MAAYKDEWESEMFVFDPADYGKWEHLKDRVDTSLGIINERLPSVLKVSTRTATDARRETVLLYQNGSAVGEIVYAKPEWHYALLFGICDRLSKLSGIRLPENLDVWLYERGGHFMHVYTSPDYTGPKLTRMFHDIMPFSLSISAEKIV